MVPGLLVTEGDKKGLYIKIPENKLFWIGRNLTTDFQINEDKAVSNRHCSLLRKGSELYLTDESRNGTRLNARKIHKTTILLKLTDIFCIGETYFQVVDVDPLASTVSMDINEYRQDIREAEKSSEIPMLREFGEYQIIELIGTGSFGVVYKAIHPRFEQLVALKVFANHPDPSQKFMGRFLRESELLKKLSHPLLICLYDAGHIEIQNVPYQYIAMEYFPGVNLTYHVKEYGKLPWKKVYSILFQVASALQYMHKNKIIHRDLKPHNILYNPIKNTLKIIDLGFGKCLTDEDRSVFYITKTGSGLGTPYYMPIEQWKSAKSVTERADIYSLGATAYYLLSGNHPYHICGSYLEVLEALSLRQLTPLETLSFPDTPPKLFEIIYKMMSFEPEERYVSCEELLQALCVLKTAEEPNP